MIIPEALYRLTPNDQGYRFAMAWRRSSQAVAVGGGDTSVTITNDLSGSVILLTSVFALSVPGSGQIVDQQSIDVLPPTGEPTPLYYIAFDDTDYAANFQASISWSGDEVIPPGWRVRAFISFGAGANDNAVRMHASGIAIPLGTLRPT